MGTATMSNVVKTVAGNKRVATGTITMSSSYATGGDTLNIESALGINNLDQIILGPAGTHILKPTSDNMKIQGYYYDYTAIAAGAAIEVPATTNLSTVSCDFIAVGR